LAEAKARVEAVKKARAEAQAAQAAAKKAAEADKAAADQAAQAEAIQNRESAAEVAPPPQNSTRSIPPGAPLSAVQLQSVIPQLPSESVPEPEEPPAPESLPPESDDDIFIAPLDLDELEPESAEEPPASVSPAISSALQRVPLLSDLNQETFVALIDQVRMKEIAKDEVLFEAGEPADAMYVVVEGEVLARTPSPAEIELGRLGEGEFFGEIGLLAEQPRQATVVATQDSMVLVFDRDIVSALEDTEPEFIRILLRFVRERLVASLIATNPLFAPFAGTEAEDLTRRFQFLEVKERKPLSRQGKPSDGVFILLTGSARVVQKEGDSLRELGQLGPGDIAYISGLASERQAENAQAQSGAKDVADDRVSLL
jgi:CRP-like cAMP-binding protein